MRGRKRLEINGKGTERKKEKEGRDVKEENSCKRRKEGEGCVVISRQLQ